MGQRLCGACTRQLRGAHNSGQLDTNWTPALSRRRYSDLAGVRARGPPPALSSTAMGRLRREAGGVSTCWKERGQQQQQQQQQQLEAATYSFWTHWGSARGWRSLSCCLQCACALSPSIVHGVSIACTTCS